MNNFGNEHRKNLEEQLKQALSDKQLAPPAHIWDNIEAALDEPVTWYRRPIVYWSAGLVAALLLVVMFWFALPPASEDMKENTATISSSQKTKTAKDNQIVKTSPSNNQNSPSSTHQLNQELIDQPAHKQTRPNQTVQTNADKGITSNQAQNNQDQNSLKETKNINRQNKTLISNTSIVDKPTQVEREVVLHLPVLEPIQLGRPIVVAKLDELNIKEDFVFQGNKKTNIETATQKERIFAVTMGATYAQGVFEPSFRTDSTYRATVTNTESSDINEVLPALRTKGTYSQLGFDLGLQLGKHWSLNTGLSMGKSSYSFTNTNTYLIPVPDIQGSFERKTEPNQVQVSYEWLQIPIAVGYQFGEISAKRITGFAQFGTSIELLSTYNYASANDQFVYQLGAHRNTIVHIFGQAGITYHLTDRWSVWGGGMYRSSLSSLIDAQGILMTTQSYGWQLGTRFIVFKSW